MDEIFNIICYADTSENALESDQNNNRREDGASMLNDCFVLKRIEPHLNSKRELSEFEFIELFSDLSLHEQYEIIKIMIANDIEYVEEKVEETNALESVVVLKSKDLDKNFNKLMHLTNEELCIMAQKGDKSALEALTDKNKRFVYQLAKKLYGQFNQTCMTIDDLYQEGNIGLIEAAERFDFTHDNKFITYCWHWVRQKITRAAIDTGFTIRIPVHMFEKLAKLNNYRRKYPSATLNELAEIINSENNEEDTVDKDDIIHLAMLSEYYLNTASLNTLVGEDEATELLDFIPDESKASVEDIVAAKQLNDDIDDALETLTPREQDVIRLRFGLEDGRVRTLEEIGIIYNVTRERIRQIEAKALRKLRHPTRSKKLISYYQEG